VACIGDIYDIAIHRKIIAEMKNRNYNVIDHENIGPQVVDGIILIYFYNFRNDRPDCLSEFNIAFYLNEVKKGNVITWNTWGPEKHSGC
jgi:hypothetical protein